MALMEEASAKYNLDKLLFRRQFVIGPYFIEELPSWKRITLRDTLYLTVHPELNTCQVTREHKVITLLGYILDPYQPQANDQEILNRLICQLSPSDSLTDFFKYTYDFGGRWILIVDDGKDIIIFNDAAGLRQIFYTNTSSPQIWCASQPGLIGELLHLKMGETALEYMNLYQNTEYWWPGDSSPYQEISHLLPNHYLNLATGIIQRYWPDQNLGRLSLEDAIEKNSEILRGLLKSACNRFDLALSLTAGRDTRVLLAASKEISDRLFYFTLIYWHLTKNSPDIKIPAKLLAKLGLPHHVIQCPPSIEEEFGRIYKKNVTGAREVYGPIAQGLYNHYPSERVCLKGNVIPIGKIHYRHRLHKLPESETAEITGLTLARLTGVHESPFAIASLERWLSKLGHIYNVDVLDLFWWEDREGNWQAMSQLEWDIVQEVFVPYNCRTFLINMLSVSEQYRKPPEYRFHHELMLKLWPETLSEPINPPYNPLTLRRIRQEIRQRIPLGFRRRVLALRDRILRW